MTDNGDKRRRARRLGGVNPNLAGAIAEVISSGSGGEVRFADVPIDALEADPDNPRRLHVERQNLRILPPDGEAGNDPLSPEQMLINGADDPDMHHRQIQEVSELIDLALSIRTRGLISPILVHEARAGYRVIAGERRLLATHMTGRQTISAKIFSERPHDEVLRTIQLVENCQRADLTLSDRMHNLELIADAWETRHGSRPAPADIKALIGCQTSTSWVYHRLLECPSDVREAVHDGKITNINRFRIICSENSPERRALMIGDSGTADELRHVSNIARKGGQPRRGRKKQRMLLQVRKMGAARRIIEALSELDPDGGWQTDDMDNFEQLEAAASSMIKRIEAHYG